MKRPLKRSTVTEAQGIPLGAVAAAANRRDDGLLAATLDTWSWWVCGPLSRSCIWTPAGYDYRSCRQVLANAAPDRLLARR